MHLHHELQRALADTKVGASSSPVLTQPHEQTVAPKVSRRVLRLLPHRPAPRDGRATPTLGTRQH
jgi:hypothetical protein